jgi:hypothetical protein
MITITFDEEVNSWHYPYHAFKFLRGKSLYVGDNVYTPKMEKGAVLKLLQFASRGLDVEIKCHLLEPR